MSNIATTIEQSKRFLELWLDPKTADMVWVRYAAGGYRLEVLHRELFERIMETDIPAWSLSALLEVMPSNIDDYDLYITKHKYVDGGHGYNVEYNRGFTISVLHKETNRDLVTAAYEMVCYLLEQGLIKKGGE
jgi:hypothetical protein